MCILTRLDVQPLKRDVIAGQQVLDFVRACRPAMPDETDAFEGRLVVGHPILNQFVQHRVELLLRRAPRLEQVIVQANRIDGANGGIDIGIGSQQDALGKRVQLK